MAKGQTGTSMGGSIVYRNQLKTTTRSCRNCKYYHTKTDSYGDDLRCGSCSHFKMSISDTSNATVCKAFANKHSHKSKKPTKRTHTSKVKK